MRVQHAILILGVLTAAGPLRGDGLLYRYEGDAVPYDPSAGWVIFDACEGVCSESIQDGRIVLDWVGGSDIVNYHYWIAESEQDAPPTLWVEWRFRSNTTFTTSPTCDGGLAVDFGLIHDLVQMLGDAAISWSGSFAVFGLEVNEFRTYRFETLDGVHYTFAVDGQVFVDGQEDSYNPDSSFIQMVGRGACGGVEEVNAWDYVRYGTLSTGETIIASNPPSGVLDSGAYADLDRFTVTFDGPNYVYIDDVTVEISGGGEPPRILKTRRRENDGPETVEIVLDRPLGMDETTRFIFDDGTSVNVIQYTLRPVPAASAWGLLVLALMITCAGTVVLRRRAF